jgi:hypothetical protein
MQNLTNSFIKKVDEPLLDKEAEIMEVQTLIKFKFKIRLVLMTRRIFYYYFCRNKTRFFSF